MYNETADENFRNIRMKRIVKNVQNYWFKGHAVSCGSLGISTPHAIPFLCLGHPGYHGR